MAEIQTRNDHELDDPNLPQCTCVHCHAIGSLDEMRDGKCSVVREAPDYWINQGGLSHAFIAYVAPPFVSRCGRHRIWDTTTKTSIQSRCEECEERSNSSRPRSAS
jgi:hypothetical protein